MTLPSRRVAAPAHGASTWSIRPPHELVVVPASAGAVPVGEAFDELDGDEVA